MAKINDRIHTDAIQAHLIPPELSKTQTSFVSANEADVLNMALFGMTAKQWREQNPGVKGNIRDEANTAQLVCLSNLENLNALVITERLLPQSTLDSNNCLRCLPLPRVLPTLDGAITTRCRDS